jgi:hypothetical protein
VRLNTLSFEVARAPRHVEVRAGHARIPASFVATGNRVGVTLSRPVVVDGSLEVTLT